MSFDAAIDVGLVHALLFVALYFEVLMLISFVDRRKSQLSFSIMPQSENAPKVAIIVPCFNEEKTVASTLSSLLALEYPHSRLEIIVVDDGSKDGTYAVAQTFAHDPRVKVFRKENGGKHTAMNFALEQTDAEFIGCLDADSIVKSDALIRMIPAFANSQVAAVTPGINVKAPQTILQHMQAAEYSLSIFNRFVLAALGATFVTPGPFSILRARVVRSLGGWRYAHSTEDMEMAMRLQEAGYLIANTPSAIVLTTTPRTVRALYRQRVRWTYGFLRNALDYRHMFGNKKYGNLGLIVLPIATISIGSAIFFFARLVVSEIIAGAHSLIRLYVTGILPHFEWSLFYFDTSALFFLVVFAVLMIILLISTGTYIATGKRTPPIGTPLFILFYSVLVPFWLGTAVVRATLKTGVRWR